MVAIKDLHSFPTRRSSDLYLYSTYEEEDEASPTERKKVIILGSGPNRIGQGIEFDSLPDAIGSAAQDEDRKSTRLNSSHSQISYAVFCLKKKTNKKHKQQN